MTTAEVNQIIFLILLVEASSSSKAGGISSFQADAAKKLAVSILAGKDTSGKGT